MAIRSSSLARAVVGWGPVRTRRSGPSGSGSAQSRLGAALRLEAARRAVAAAASVPVPAAQDDALLDDAAHGVRPEEPPAPQFGAELGPRYSALVGVAATDAGPAASVIRDHLVRAEVLGDDFWGDGVHLNSHGMHSLVPHVRALAEHHAADLIVSDSTLCTVESDGSRDREGSVAKELLAALGDFAYPAWGHAFTGGWNTFWKAVNSGWWAYRKTRQADPTTILLLVAGNDCTGSSPPEDITSAAEELVRHLREWRIRLVIVDVVPPTWHRH